MDDNSHNFLDKNTLLAIGLSIIFFIGWQFYVQKKYPQVTKEKVEKVQSVTNDGAAPVIKKIQIDAIEAQEKASQINESQNLKEQLVDIKFNNISGQLSSIGMGFKFIELNNYTDRSDELIRFSGLLEQQGNFSTRIDDQKLNFVITKENDLTFIGTAQFEGATIVKKMVFNDENYAINIELQVINGQVNENKKIIILLADQVLEVKSSFLTPSYEGTEFFTIDAGKENRERIDIEKPFTANYEQSSLTAVGSQYFAVALKDQSDVIPQTKFTYNPQDLKAIASVEYGAKTLNSENGIKFTGFVGPKKYDILKNLDVDFVKMINYGIFSLLSKPILTMLKWLYSLFQNWGLAIILLTVFIRLLLLPINISSLKSMKKMQKIQPQLKAIKEKYKDDPVRVNQETMALMKKEKANPLGGCLPMLLQLPVFFALYSVLGQSVELYKSPFIFWIHDLSYQDPFFVLPIAVGALYFIQMNITPQPMDPAQAKVMKFIPILFSFFMITVPSGLTLYFFVNTIFGIGQQLVFQNEKKKATA